MQRYVGNGIKTVSHRKIEFPLNCSQAVENIMIYEFRVFSCGTRSILIFKKIRPILKQFNVTGFDVGQNWDELRLVRLG